MEPKQFIAKLKENQRPVIVDLWAPWCAPCRVMEPTLNKVVKKYENQVDVWKLNADEIPEVVRALNVMGIPTTIGFADGKEVIRKTGVQTIESLDILFDATLHQRSTIILPPAPIDRWIRSILGIALMIWGWSMHQSILILAVGGIVLFSAFYDRCPIFRAIAPRLISMIKKLPKTSQKEKPSL